jgi:hypothetical protein
LCFVGGDIGRVRLGGLRGTGGAAAELGESHESDCERINRWSVRRQPLLGLEKESDGFTGPFALSSGPFAQNGCPFLTGRQNWDEIRSGSIYERADVQIVDVAILESMGREKLGSLGSPTLAVSRGGEAIRYPGPLLLFTIATVAGSLSFARFYSYTGSSGDLRQLFGNWLIFLSCYYAWVALAPLAFRLEKRFPLNKGQLLKSLLVLIPMNVPFSLAAVVLFNIISQVGRVFVSTPNTDLTTFEPRELLVHVCFFWASIVGGRVVRYQAKLQEGQRAATQLALEKSKLETSLKEAELEVLRMRLNPHFLFNTLQNISVLVHDDPKTANQMLVRLGDLMRAAFRREIYFRGVACRRSGAHASLCRD